MKRKRQTKWRRGPCRRLKLPSEPRWLDVLPRIRALKGGDLPFAVSVPGGRIVAGFLTEELAREFVAFLGAEYASRAESTLRAMDDLVRREVPTQETKEAVEKARWHPRTRRVLAAHLL